ncbi:MAG: proprotein convertase P-domain-containing protein [Deltaproteobacteria bacterium]|nr:proprotein convertase P-domain-containing protein [Nannocystaceae bacterium]
MRFAKKLTVLALASIPLGCPGDDTSPVSDDSSSSGGNEEESSNTNSTTITTTVDPDSSSGSSDSSGTMTTVDPDSSSSGVDESSSSTDPTKGEESSSSTDPTKGEESSSSTDPTDPSESSSSGATDPTSATSESGSESSTGEPGECPENDLGSTVPQSFVLDTSLGADDSFIGECINPKTAGSPDTTFLFTAPAAGTYFFTTSRLATAYDTTLYVLDGGCDGATLGCDDDAGTDAQSLVFVDLAADQSVVVVVDGLNGASGTAELYIDLVPAAGDGGGCCTAAPDVAGCDTDPVEACVCGFDDSCCGVEWDATCVSEAVDFCNAECAPPQACIEPQDECLDPEDDCSCVGCNNDGLCDVDDDCTCIDCAAADVCGVDACEDDGLCDPYGEGCLCADCADEVVCTGGADACAIGDGSVFTDDVGGAIVDNTTLVLPIDVADVTGVVWDVTLQVALTHTFSGDVDIALRSPAGTLINVSTDNGGVNDNVYDGTVFNDNAPTAITDTVFANLVAVATATPENAFGTFRGQDPNGTWQLEVGDDAVGDVGTVVSWSLTLTPADPAPTYDAPQSFAISPALVFDEITPAVSTVSVDGPASICDLTVTTNVTHTFSSDIVMTLTSPSGTVTSLARGVGGSLDNVFAGTVWDDGAVSASDFVYANLVTATPLSPEGTLSTFLGEDPTGDWTLTVADAFATDNGTLNSWSLDITSCDCE